MDQELESATIDFVILADRAEAVSGKLYLMGGAWDRVFVINPDDPVQFSLAIGILVPWALANEDHQLTIFIEDADGHRVANTELSVIVNVGRPAGSVQGQSFRGLIAVNNGWRLGGLGAYRVVAVLENGSRKSSTFYLKRAVAMTPIREP